MFQPRSIQSSLTFKDKIYSIEEVQMIKSKLNYSLERNDIKFIDEIFSFKN